MQRVLMSGLLCAVMLVGYPVSLGPVWCLERNGFLAEPAGEMLHTVYAPLLAGIERSADLPDESFLRSHPLGLTYLAWLDLWPGVEM